MIHGGIDEIGIIITFDICDGRGNQTCSSLMFSVRRNFLYQIERQVLHHTFQYFEIDSDQL